MLGIRWALNPLWAYGGTPIMGVLGMPINEHARGASTVVGKVAVNNTPTMGNYRNWPIASFPMGSPLKRIPIGISSSMECPWAALVGCLLVDNSLFSMVSRRDTCSAQDAI